MSRIKPEETTKLRNYETTKKAKFTNTEETGQAKLLNTVGEANPVKRLGGKGIDYGGVAIGCTKVKSAWISSSRAVVFVSDFGYI